MLQILNLIVFIKIKITFFFFGMQINAKGIEQNKRLYVQIHGLPIILAILIGATP